MSELPLGGLVGTEPIGFLAALGLLRVLDERDPGVFRLAFGPDGAARLATPGSMTQAELVDLLVQRQPERADAAELAFADDIKLDPVAWAEVLERGRDDARVAAFLAAYGSDLATAGNGDVKPTALHMTAGQQKFLKIVRGLAAELSTPPKVRKGATGPTLSDSYHEALFGPWRYADSQHPLGWDPGGERLYAYRAGSPSKDNTPSSVKTAVWLAFEALPLFPVFVMPSRYRPALATTGFHRLGPDIALVWPLWRYFATLDGASSLLAARELVDAVRDGGTRRGRRHAQRLLAARGVTTVCRSVRADLGDKGYAILRPAELLPIVHEEREE